MPFWPIWDNKRAIYFALLRVSGELFRLRNCSKLVKRSLFAIIGLLQGTKSILLFFVWRVGGWFSQKCSNFRKNFFFDFVIFHWIFKCYYCSINFKRQSEHSGLRPDTSSLVHFSKMKIISYTFFRPKSKSYFWQSKRSLSLKILMKLL